MLEMFKLLRSQIPPYTCVRNMSFVEKVLKFTPTAIQIFTRAENTRRYGSLLNPTCQKFQ